MRILLAQPPLLPASEVTPPLGLCTLASWLQYLGHQVRIIDLDLEVKTVPRDAQQLYVELFIAELANFRPEVVAVTSMYSNSLQAERLVRVAKQYGPAIVTVAGGSHFGALGIHSLHRIRELDYVVEGEGEATFASLLEALDGGEPVSDIGRLCYRAGGEARSNPASPLLDLAKLPPMWSTLEGCISLDRYASTIPEHAARRIMYIEAGRGCPFACTFCATAPFWQRKYRVKPVHRIVDEIKFLYEQLGYDSFILVHDLLTVNQRFMSEFCDAMLEARLPVEWMANSRTDIRLRGLLPKMKAAGCWKLFMGVESASERVQESIDKHLNMDDVLSTVIDLGEHGISATCSFIIGFPDESAVELSPTIGLGARLKLLGVETVQFHRLRLFPPSRLTRANLSGEFDLDSLRIEYPFINIPEDDIEAIESDPEFFAGYFTPNSQAGSSEQLAQVEMFFHHTVALAPITIRALAHFAGEDLVPSFYRALSEQGNIMRESLDWESGNLRSNWLALRPLLDAWVQGHVKMDAWQLELVCGLIGYEEHRLHFVSSRDGLVDRALTCGDNWAAFALSVDVVEVLGRLRSNVRLTPELLTHSIIVLARETPATFAAYTVDTSLLPRLLSHQPEIVSAFTV